MKHVGEKGGKKQKNKYCFVREYGIIFVVECTDIEWGMKKRHYCDFQQFVREGGSNNDKQDSNRIKRKAIYILDGFEKFN